MEELEKAYKAAVEKEEAAEKTVEKEIKKSNSNFTAEGTISKEQQQKEKEKAAQAEAPHFDL